MDVTDPAALIQASKFSLQSGMPDLERLYELGKKRQWNAAELPWEQLDFGCVPSPLRAGLAELLAQIHYGELGALTASARLVQTAPNLVDRLCGATQVADEARHVEWFSRLLFQLDAPSPVKPALAAFIDDVVNTTDPLALLIGMNILVEGLAQTLILEAGHVLRSIQIEELSSLALVGTWLVDRIAQDESRHLAFGVMRVRQAVDGLDRAKHTALEKQVGRWAQRLLALTEERSEGVAAFGIDGDALMAKCLTDTRSRLSHAGLSLEV
jgi:hypothetical protein